MSKEEVRDDAANRKEILETMPNNLLEAVLDSWDRQCRIVNAVAGLVSEDTKNLKPASDSWPIYVHLAHMHSTRKYFLRQFDEDAAKSLPFLFPNGMENPVSDLDVIREALSLSAIAVRKAVDEALSRGIEKVGWYDNALLYQQHLIWHEGWHIGLVMQALRLGGQEPTEDWEEASIWGEWRTEEWEEG